MYGNGVEQDIERAKGVAEYLHNYQKYEELTKVDNIKLGALKQMANYYNNGYVKKDERSIFEIALELYSKKQYKDAYNIFLKLTNSNGSEIKLITTYFKASYNITENISSSVVVTSPQNHKNLFKTCSFCCTKDHWAINCEQIPQHFCSYCFWCWETNEHMVKDCPANVATKPPWLTIQDFQVLQKTQLQYHR
ncbi:31416_t:CDS:2 [Gigaspora margarita]|uniref:31416_t:CDS:1 n=1 Tax=Gigaspora margarita TaxID=4874 RepID=A0ABN7UZF7_GIGMA|nr:31416_t:CDS:2 [Gigaspora margarita]